MLYQASRALLTPSQGICHCTHCQKFTRSTYLTFGMIPYENFAFTTGQPTPFTFTHKAGPKIHVSRCSECGVAICKGMGGDDSVIIVFARTLDDGGTTLAKMPQVELWNVDRIAWCGQVGKGAMGQFEGFPPS